MSSNVDMIWYCSNNLRNPYYQNYGTNQFVSFPKVYCFSTNDPLCASIYPSFQSSDNDPSYMRLKIDSEKELNYTKCNIKVEVLTLGGIVVHLWEDEFKAGVAMNICPHSALYEKSHELLVKIFIYRSYERTIAFKPIVIAPKKAMKHDNMCYVVCDGSRREEATLVQKQILTDNFPYFAKMLSGNYKECKNLPWVELQACSSQGAFDVFVYYLYNENIEGDVSLEVLLDAFEFCRIIIYPEMQEAIVKHLCSGKWKYADLHTFSAKLGDSVPNDESSLWMTLYKEMVSLLDKDPKSEINT